MPISALKKLLHLLKNSDSQKDVKSLEEISEQNPNESDEMENSELEIQNSEYENMDSECEMENEDPEDETADAVTISTENNRSHLTSSVPRAAGSPVGAITKGELAEIRRLFNNLDDGEIQRLYKKVTKNN